MARKKSQSSSSFPQPPHGDAVAHRPADPSAPSATTLRAPVETRVPYIGPACCQCGDPTLVSPCARSGCDRWVSICQGCPGVVNLFVATDGLCEKCREK